MSGNISSIRDEVIQAIEQKSDLDDIKRLFDNALLLKNWDVVKLICEMEDGQNKPAGATKEAILKNAIDSKNWQNVYDIESTFKEIKHVLVEGPLVKSSYTIELESLARKLMSKIDLMPAGCFEIISKNGDDYFKFKDGGEFNWTQIRKNANLQHITFGEAEFASYSNYLKSEQATKEAKSSLQENKEEEYRKALYKHYSEEKIPNEPISFAEMQAINIFSGEFHEEMNGLMRDEPQKLDYRKADKNTIRAALIHSVMCASGLRKVPETPIKTTYRGASMGTPAEQAERVKAAATNGVVSLPAFVSSSTLASTMFTDSKPVIYKFSNVIGVYIEPISKSPGEKEFLIPATQVQLTSFRKTKERGRIQYLFEGACVSPLKCDVISKKEGNKVPQESEIIQNDTSKKVQDCKAELAEIKTEKQDASLPEDNRNNKPG